METILLYDEFRLVERSEHDINGAWKGAHLLLFFLAFVFGSFCTFCFHMLMYMFDEKCVLFPKLLALTSLRHTIIFEFMPADQEMQPDLLPVDFLNTQWMEKSVCYLPAYVPLVSAIFGVVWTTIFLMCSTGSHLTGLQKPWHILPPVFMFSIVMCGICMYTSIVTQNGLEELCLKLGEFTDSKTCTYTVNVATLAYERRIRGVYQAIRLTILSAWLHTCCWLLSACLTLARVILVVDFQLVRVTAELQGNTEKMLERHETQIRTVSPDTWIKEDAERKNKTSAAKVQFKNKPFNIATETDERTGPLAEIPESTLFLSQLQSPSQSSELALVPEEWQKLKGKPNKKEKSSIETQTSDEDEDSILSEKVRHDDINIYIKKIVLRELSRKIKSKNIVSSELIRNLSKLQRKDGKMEEINVGPESTKQSKFIKKSNLKNKEIQTEEQKKTGTHKVHIDDVIQSDESETQPDAKIDVDKETQAQTKEKQD